MKRKKTATQQPRDMLARHARSLPGRVARVARIRSKADYEKATAIIVHCRQLLKQVDETFDPIVRKARDTLQEARSQKVRIADPFNHAINALRPLVSAWEDKEEAKQQLRAAKIEEQALKAQKRAREKQAQILERSGDKRGAHALRKAPIAPPAVPREEPAAAAGYTSRKIWKARITDVRALFRALVTGKAPMPAFGPQKLDQLASLLGLHAAARRLKENTEIPGVRAVPTRAPVARAQT